jgi:hypothetical protein
MRTPAAFGSALPKVGKEDEVAAGMAQFFILPSMSYNAREQPAE